MNTSSHIIPHYPMLSYGIPLYFIKHDLILSFIIPYYLVVSYLILWGQITYGVSSIIRSKMSAEAEQIHSKI